MRIPILVLAAAIVLAPVIWHVGARLSAPDRPDSALEERLAFLEVELDALRARIREFEESTPVLPDGDTFASLPPGETASLPPGETGSRFGGFDDLMLLSARSEMNVGMTPLTLAALEDIFGIPTPDLSQKCAEPESGKLRAALETRDVGPFRARLITPALDSLERVLARVKEDYPELYRQLRNYGGFCARLVRGSTESISRHSFGVAIDISIGGTLDAMGDGKTQFGLIIMRDYFQEEGWIWGAGFGREDSMHFEVSAELLESWRQAGLF